MPLNPPQSKPAETGKKYRVFRWFPHGGKQFAPVCVKKSRQNNKKKQLTPHPHSKSLRRESCCRCSRSTPSPNPLPPIVGSQARGRHAHHQPHRRRSGGPPLAPFECTLSAVLCSPWGEIILVWTLIDICHPRFGIRNGSDVRLSVMHCMIYFWCSAFSTWHAMIWEFVYLSSS
jgi:hypothetical protein